jgi:hypothetical protein
MYEKRLTTRLTNYWQKINNGELPLKQSFNSAAISDVWDSCLMVAIHPSGGGKYSYKYDYVGSQLIAALGKDVTGLQVLARQQDFPGGKILEKIDDMLTNPVPMTDEGQFINDKHKIVKYRSCLLPLGNAQKLVTHVVAGMSWKAF